MSKMLKRRVFCARRQKHGQKRMHLLIFLLFLALAFYIVTFLYSKITPMLRALAITEVQNAALLTINEVVSETVGQENLHYADFVNLQKNGEGDIIAISLNTMETNRLKAQLAKEIEEKIANIDTAAVSIPVGSLLASDVFAGMGPRIPIKIIPMGYSVVDIKDSFTSAGINQTKHSVYLEISATMGVVTPLYTNTAKVSTQIPVCETVLVGKVPNFYLGSQNDNPLAVTSQ